MQITIRFFARAKDLAGTGTFALGLPDASTVQDAKALLIERYPELRPLWPTMLIAVDGDFATNETVLRESSELACFPPVSGG